MALAVFFYDHKVRYSSIYMPIFFFSFKRKGKDPEMKKERKKFYLTNIPILNIPSRLGGMFTFDLSVCLFDEMLQKHFRGDGDDKGGVVGALGNVRVGVDDFFDAGD